MAIFVEGLDCKYKVFECSLCIFKTYVREFPRNSEMYVIRNANCSLLSNVNFKGSKKKLWANYHKFSYEI
jgi:hypothetical protein